MIKPLLPQCAGDRGEPDPGETVDGQRATKGARKNPMKASRRVPHNTTFS
jgi:hypothetical protein